MKRSEINNAIRHAISIMDKINFRLPSFAYWTIDEWKARKSDIHNLKSIMLGWDITDFGMNDFAKVGAVLFTLRNGSIKDASLGTPYAEKVIIMLSETEQYIPLHFHRMKTEDIINRGGGILVLELYNSYPDDGLDKESDVNVLIDGFRHTLPAGAIVEIEKGDSITLQPGLYHRFWAKKGAGDLVIGEVSSINDDNVDNVFYDVKSRFSEIEEDEPPFAPLSNEYDKLL